jgi:excisionase family DNA binding protein
MADEPDILTLQEAAEFLRVPPLTMQRQVKAGRVPGRRIGKEWRFSRTVLIEWMASGPDRHDLERYNRRVDADDEDSDQADTDQAEPSDEQDSA